MVRPVSTAMLMSDCTYPLHLLHCHNVPLQILLQYPTVVHPSLFVFCFKRNIFYCSPNIPNRQRDTFGRMSVLNSRSRKNAACRVMRPGEKFDCNPLCQHCVCVKCCQIHMSENNWCYKSPGLQCHLHSHTLSNKKCADLVSIKSAVILEEVNSGLYPNTVKTNYKVPESLRDVFTTGFYACYSRSMYSKRSDTPETYSAHNICHMTI